MEPLPPLAFIVLLFAGLVNRQQQAIIDYLLEENPVLRTADGQRRVRLTTTSAAFWRSRKLENSP